MAQPPGDHACVRTTKPEAAAAARISAGLALRNRNELLGLLRPCFARTEPWLQAGKYVSALGSDVTGIAGEARVYARRAIASISAIIAGLSLRYIFAFSRP